ncbi:MAG: secondary thiamine-phosphate synthase enzyme YjbQ [Myxococcota bacterium]
MRQAHGTIEINTRRRGLYDVTAQIAAWLTQEGARDGLCVTFLQHTSASLVVQENADAEVRADLERFFARLVPDGDPLFRHTAEGPDDMPAHVRAALTATQLSIPVVGGRLELGTWQAVYVYEHRLEPHRRRLALHYLGD